MLNQQYRLEDALSCYQKAIAINPGFSQAYYNIGVIQDLNRKQKEAITSYEKAIEINP
ncbi:MAG: tetratricopeptide repeat protein, partial [Magnetococcales bacterium]|nr:tetratricopeptide repeat protein [Magnetococcales bacterium]